MKVINYILLDSIFCCIIGLNAHAQIHIDTVSFRYYNGITAQEQIIDRYQIINNSKEDYLTWVSITPIENKSNTELIQDFFKKRRGDFCFVEMMYENLLNEQLIDIGYSFVKNIMAGEIFLYTIIKTDKNSTFYQNRIVVIKKEEVEQQLRMQIQNKYFYPLTNVFLIERID